MDIANTTLTYQNWMRFLDEENLVLSFKGEFNPDLINAILLLSSDKKHFNESNKTAKNRIVSVIVECTQNICKHAADDPERKELKPGIIVVGKEPNAAIIYTGNLIHNPETENLRQKMEILKNMNKYEMEALEQEVIANGTLSEKSGAGLGLITIFKKSQKLHYDIQRINDKLSFFSLQVQVSTDPN